MGRRAMKQANGDGERPKRYKTKSGETRWRARYSVRVNGKRVQRLITGTSAEDVRNRTREAIAASRSGLAPKRQFATIAEYVDHWRDNVVPYEGLAPATLRFYEEMLRYVLPEVGQLGFTGRNAIGIADVNAMTAKLSKRGLSVRVQRAARVTLSKVLAAAQNDDLVSRNVARLAKAPKDAGRERVVKALTTSESHAVQAAVRGSRWYPVVVLGFATGLRPGELLALHWDELDLDGTPPHVTVKRSLSHVGGATLKAPKTKRSERTVPFSPRLVSVLRAWRKQQAEERLAAGDAWSQEWPGLVFTSPDGRPQRIDTYRIAVGRLVREAKDRDDVPGDTPHFHPHMTRHTYATTLCEAGTPIHHVAELLGDTVATVESTYKHALRIKTETAAVIESLFA